jgi:hypothetical protein
MLDLPLKGRYRHYKGNEYEVIRVGTHSETGERLLWLRPLTMFIENVDYQGNQQPRDALVVAYEADTQP